MTGRRCHSHYTPSPPTQPHLRLLLRPQHIVVIVSPQHKEAFEEIFHNQLDIRDFNRLPPRLRQYAAQLWRNYGEIRRHSVRNSLTLHLSTQVR